jgi:hypothetical protein
MKSSKYYLSCYTRKLALFSVPLLIDDEKLKHILLRGDFPVNGEPLTKNEFIVLRNNLINNIEIGWHPKFNYYLEERE